MSTEIKKVKSNDSTIKTFKRTNIKDDGFFTKENVSLGVIKILTKLFPDLKNKNIIEPAAGDGSFVKNLINLDFKKIQAFDIQDHQISDEKVKKLIKVGDYFKTDIKFSKDNFVLGNPPFGKKGVGSLEFLNKALKESEYVAFILPKTFMRYSVQKEVNVDAKLIYQKVMGKNSFLYKGKDANINTVLQIWTTDKTNKSKDLRILVKEPNKHEDFKTFTYNNQEYTKKFFDREKYKWDFGLHRQGHYDFNHVYKTVEEIPGKRQILFVKIINPIAREVFAKIDFNKIAEEKFTTIPGFSNTDLVAEYNRIKKEIFKETKTEKTNEEELEVKLDENENIFEVLEEREDLKTMEIVGGEVVDEGDEEENEEEKVEVVPVVEKVKKPKKIKAVPNIENEVQSKCSKECVKTICNCKGGKITCDTRLNSPCSCVIEEKSICEGQCKKVELKNPCGEEEVCGEECKNKKCISKTKIKCDCCFKPLISSCVKELQVIKVRNVKDKQIYYTFNTVLNHLVDVKDEPKKLEFLKKHLGLDEVFVSHHHKTFIVNQKDLFINKNDKKFIEKFDELVKIKNS